MHKQFKAAKYRRLFSSKPKRKPGPRGPDPEIIKVVIEFKRFNPRCGCRRIANQLSSTFGIDLDKEEVRRILGAHYKPSPNSQGPSWLNLLGHSKDSLWSMGLFQAESINLKTHWILVVMDHLLFWNARDLQNKLNLFQAYYNEHRTNLGINGAFPSEKASGRNPPTVDITDFSWNSHCNGLFKMPNAA